MKVRVVKRGDKYLAQYKDSWFYWTTLSHYPLMSDWPELNLYDTPEAALYALNERFESTIVYEGKI